MNLARPPLAAVGHAFRFWLTLRRLLPRRKCQTFGVQGAENPSHWADVLDDQRMPLIERMLST